MEQSNQSSSYQYTPLQYPDSIRLLILCAGEFASPIQIALAEVRSRDDQRYEALSYSWATEDGDCHQSSEIRCDGGKILFVTKNCELALRYLRKRNSQRTLWVDAISINQVDIRERGHQVEMMRDIYANATGVLIWLGEMSKEVAVPSNCVPSKDKSTQFEQSSDLSQIKSGNVSSAAISVSEIFLESLSKMMAEVRQMERKGQSPKSSPLYQEFASQLYESMTSGRWNAYCQGFRDIVGRRWWSRVWVVQEVFVARSATLVCSEKCTPYQDFFDWYQVLIPDYSAESGMILRYFGSALQHLDAQNTATVAGRVEPLIWVFQLLIFVRRLHASNPRDKIFGILGLSDTFRSQLPSPDYSKSVTTIFTSVAKTFLVKTKSLAILWEAPTTAPISGHPSWVPDWSQPPNMAYYGENIFTAARKSEPIFTFSQDDLDLQVKGKIFDEIEGVQFADSTTYALRNSLKDRIPGFLKSYEVASALMTYPTSESVEEALWRTLCWNLDIDGSTRASPGRANGFREWRRSLESGDPDTIFSALFSQRNSFQLLVKPTTPLCATAKEYLAAVPCTTEEGDRIAILSGGNLPVILRPNGDDYYRLVGPCYVHGIMDGEAFPDDLEELEWLSIR